LPQNLTNREQLETALGGNGIAYNTIRPQFSLQGKTPAVTFSGKPIAINAYKNAFLRTENLENISKPTK
jgi:hypothetical protein